MTYSSHGAKLRMTAAGCEVTRRSCYPEKASRACGPGAFPVGEVDVHPGTLRGFSPQGSSVF